MTPTHLALLRRDVSSSETEALALPLTPAPKPAAVLVPPAALFAASVAVTVAASALLDGRGAPVLLLRPMIVVAVLAAVSAAASAFAAGLRPWPRRGAVAATVLIVAAILEGAIFAAPLGGAADAAAVATAFFAPGLWAAWRVRWTRKRMVRVSLLAPTDWAAYEALQRLEVVPWVRVTSVYVPDGDPELAGRLLQRPVAPSARGGPRLERRVVVSCPARDSAVGGAIAQLVALGHEITSESATLREAEGRVNSMRADPLNLVLGRPRSLVDAAASRCST